MKIDRNSNTPIYIQIYNDIAEQITNGYLLPGDRLASRRGLCRELGIAQQTAENAYQKLVADGYAVSKPGSGYYVSAEQPSDQTVSGAEKKIYNFSTNGVETSKLPFEIWSKLLRDTVKDDMELFQHGDKAGEHCLRKSIRRLLFRTQNIRCKTEQIIIGPGAGDLLRYIFALARGRHGVIMNNYFNYRVNAAAVSAGIGVSYVSCGRNGISLDKLSEYSNSMLYQKPTHDLPTAVTLGEEKRKALIDWAEKNSSYIIEDSAENDYQFGNKKKTLWELSGGKNVIYLGSFSSTVAPSMKIGYIVVPDDFAELWFSRNRFYENRVSRAEQVTLSKFIDLGYYERHIKYMRDIYHEKCMAVRNTVRQLSIADAVSITGDDCGLYCNMSFDIYLPEQEFFKQLLDKGVKLCALTAGVYDRSCAACPENTYNIGYGDLKISEIREGFEIIAALVKKYARTK